MMVSACNYFDRLSVTGLQAPSGRQHGRLQPCAPLPSASSPLCAHRVPRQCQVIAVACSMTLKDDAHDTTVAQMPTSVGYICHSFSRVADPTFSITPGQMLCASLLPQLMRRAAAAQAPSSDNFGERSPCNVSLQVTGHPACQTSWRSPQACHPSCGRSQPPSGLCPCYMACLVSPGC